jgi:hypothetical protein
VAIGVIQPLQFLGGLLMDHFGPDAESTALLYAEYPTALTFDRVATAAHAALVLAFVLAAGLVRARRVGAIRLCRRLLLAAPALAFGKVALAYFWLDAAVYHGAALPFTRDIVRSVGFAAIWTAYLARSRRVRLTFPND